jgi:hypothetical protein
MPKLNTRQLGIEQSHIPDAPGKCAVQANPPHADVHPIQRDARMHKTKHTTTRLAVHIRGQPLILSTQPPCGCCVSARRRCRLALWQQALPYIHPCPSAALAATIWLLRLCTQQLQPCRTQTLPCIVAASPSLHLASNRCMRYRPARGIASVERTQTLQTHCAEGGYFPLFASP